MKKISIITVVIIVLVVVAIVLVSSNRYSTLENNESSFAVKDTATITKVFIADKNDNEVLLSKTDKGWLLNNNYLEVCKTGDVEYTTRVLNGGYNGLDDRSDT